ncbi:MAG: peptidyl-prolyl cis-trans isomerase [Puniceicoccales bacterium]|jgi:peptidyl-prolyl cis-trans isomerase D|nr:peptidyl-prolyl cis-trans isomerase [Puniceicoccales bacterium]
MISSLENLLQKHHKWLFSILLFIVIVSFVFTVGSSPGIGRRKAKPRIFFGYDLNSQKDTKSLLEETRMSAVLNGRFDLLYFGGLQDEALMRAIKIDMANKMNIPVPDKKALDDFVEKYRMFSDKDGKFSPSAYNSIVGSLVKQDDDAEILKHAMENDFRLQFIENAIGGCGFAFEQQAEEQIKIDEAKWSMSLASLKADEIPDSFSDEELMAFFESNKIRYQFPEKLAASYVEFEKDVFRNFMPPATKDVLKNFYMDRKHQFEKFEADKDALKTAIIDEYEKFQLKKLAMKAADDFVYGLYDKGLIYGSESFNNFLKDNKISEKLLPNLDPHEPPSDLDLPKKVFKNLANLDQTKYFSDPYETGNGNAVVLFLKEKIPPSPMAFDEAKSLVRSDYSKKEARIAFDKKCSETFKEIETLIKNGMTFQAAALEKKLEIQDHKDKTLDELHRELSSAKLQQLMKHIAKKNVDKLIKEKEDDNGCNYIYIYDVNMPEVADPKKIADRLAQLEANVGNIFARNFLLELAEDALEKYKNS